MKQYLIVQTLSRATSANTTGQTFVWKEKTRKREKKRQGKEKRKDKKREKTRKENHHSLGLITYPCY
jgi:hypothetical protein